MQSTFTSNTHAAVLNNKKEGGGEEEERELNGSLATKLFSSRSKSHQDCAYLAPSHPGRWLSRGPAGFGKMVQCTFTFKHS